MHRTPHAQDPGVRVDATCDIFVLAGEPSGDAYGAAILRRLSVLHRDLVCAAMGGHALRQAGAEIEQDNEGLAVMGLWPVLRRLPAFLALGRRLAEVIRSRRPRVVLTIDYPGFNLRLVRQLQDLRRSGTRLVHLVAPQVWAWGPRRAKAIAGSLDRILCFFPFEPPLFNRYGGHAEFVGHPLVDLVPEQPGTRAVDQALDLRAEDRVLLLAPGSREREIGQLLGLFDQVATSLLPTLRGPGRTIGVVSKTPDQPRNLYRRWTDLPLYEGPFQSLCARSHAGLIASGTATLEAALLGVPHVICARLDAITAACVRQAIVVPHVGLPNIVHRRRICPEILQDQLEPRRLAAHLRLLWQGPRRQACLEALAGTRVALGGGGAIERISGIVAEELGLHDGSFRRGRRGTEGAG